MIILISIKSLLCSLKKIKRHCEKGYQKANGGKNYNEQTCKLGTQGGGFTLSGVRDGRKM